MSFVVVTEGGETTLGTNTHARGETTMTRWTPPSGSLVGMIHLAALPGTPRNEMPVAAMVARAVDET